jgi:DNA-binding transcriptional MerR regulator/methylmalonyl-CoA mutase cobalamin-binding subunit
MNLSQHRYSIRQVVELTGISEFTLRAWELRYGAFKPKRTQTGRRLYANEDLLKARTLYELTQQNHKISDIASLSTAKLKALLSTPAVLIETQACAHISSVLKFTQLFQWDEVQEIFFNRREELGLLEFVTDFILPFLQALNDQITKNQISIAQEHILSSYIKENLHILSGTPAKNRTHSRLVLAGIEGDFHEIGLLISLVLAKHAGCQTLFLGANVPKRDLCETSVRFKATHIILSSTVSKSEGAKDDFLEYLHFMDQNLPSQIEFWLGGRNALQNKFALKRKNVKISNFTELRKKLKIAGLRK